MYWDCIDPVADFLLLSRASLAACSFDAQDCGLIDPVADFLFLSRACLACSFDAQDCLSRSRMEFGSSLKIANSTRGWNGGELSGSEPAFGGPSMPALNTKGYSSTYLAMGFANVRAGTQKRRGANVRAGTQKRRGVFWFPARTLANLIARYVLEYPFVLQVQAPPRRACLGFRRTCAQWCAMACSRKIRPRA